jgi:F-type H+-transporting ATPase subunit delta
MSATEQPSRHETALDDATRHVARVYAEALLNAAAKAGRDGEMLQELEALVGDVFARDPGLEVFLASPAVTRHQKADVLRKALGGRADELLLNFLLVLNEHDRLGALRAVAAVYRELYDERSGRIKVNVTSAVPLSDEQQDRLRHRLREQFHREPVLQTRLDPDLLGGLVVQVGDWVWDASVRTQLAEIRDQIIERSTHAIQSGRNRFSD